MIASAQEGKSALVRLWDFATGKCLALLCGHASGMACVDISGDGRALLGVGLDSHSKQQMTLWDISDVRTTRRAPVLLKATTEYNIKRARFSPYEPDKFMTVGRDSIRLYRVKNGGLRGLSIQVRPHPCADSALLCAPHLVSAGHLAPDLPESGEHACFPEQALRRNGADRAAARQRHSACR